MSLLDPTERSLLAQIAGGDDAACDVLADHWVEHGHAARGELLRVQRELATHPGDRRLRAAEHELLVAHGERWLAPALAAGFPREQLVLERGFLHAPLVLSADEPAEALLGLSPVIYRELGRAECNGRVFEARAVTAGGEGERVLLKTADPRWPEVVYDEDIRQPSAINRMMMRGHALRREDEQNLSLALPGGVHLSHVLGVWSRSDPEHGQRPAGRPLGLAFAVAVAHAACRALAAVHDAGAVHSELTPENILLSERGDVHLLDLYPSRYLFDTWMPWSQELTWHASSEQCMGEAIDARTDVFTLALVTCTLIAGEHPLAGNVSTNATVFERLDALRHRRLALPARLPPEIERVLRAALAEHAHRYPSASVFGYALARAAEGARIPYGPDVIAATLGSLPALLGSADPDR